MINYGWNAPSSRDNEGEKQHKVKNCQASDNGTKAPIQVLGCGLPNEERDGGGPINRWFPRIFVDDLEPAC
jgi:hypothetical protein